ncbi:lysophospholipase [Phlyctochytrium arcticum]|nr:lysophospholipase [Phlyctochytrium arcticum]
MQWIPSVVSNALGWEQDLTEGRASVARANAELLFDESKYHTSTHKTPFRGDIVYSRTWELSGKSQPVADVVHIHGLHDYGTRWADTEWPKSMVESKFRVTSPDLLGHGRTTGTHGHFNSVDDLVELVREVILRVVRTLPKSQTGKIFLFAGSLGGLVALTYALKYGADQQCGPSGMLILCPLVSAAADSRPSYATELVAKALCSVVPSLPLAEANRGKNGGDEEAFLSDPLTYHGRLRVGTGLAMLRAFEHLQSHLADIKTPFLAVHGSSDRVTSPDGSRKLYEVALATDKTLHISEGQEHDLLREPKSKELLGVCLEWLNKRV